MLYCELNKDLHVRTGIASAMQLSAKVRVRSAKNQVQICLDSHSEKMAEAIDLDHPLLDVGMNSMQLTLLVSFLRTESGSSFSIGELFMLPVIRFVLVQTCVNTTVD
jgi:hypothetical protein